MTSINIQTANSKLINAIGAVIALDPEAIITYEDEPSLSEADRENLKELLDADNRGELKYKTFEEFNVDMKAYLKSLGA